MAFHKGFGKRCKGKKRANYMADLFWTSSFKGKSQKGFGKGKFLSTPMV